uniref:Uncharacterized protein n=1 Tax=Meloidogyne enterolobii TaxID=390850 RepID=A0A6V7WN27_MELEN|nr:unnamed protein product [Meloidogyne enterolobii]
MLPTLNYSFITSVILILNLLILFNNPIYSMRASGRTIENEPRKTLLTYGDVGYGLSKFGRKIETQKYFVPKFLLENNYMQPLFRRRFT